MIFKNGRLTAARLKSQSAGPRVPRSIQLSVSQVPLVLCGLLPCFAASAHAQGLQVSYESKGVQSLSYNGVVLENVSSSPADGFHIWHMKATDLAGNVLNSGQYGWGEINNGESWNAGTQTETYAFSWGSIATQFTQNGDNLDITVTETNNAGSGVLFDGAEVFPLALHFPIDPGSFNGYSQYAITTTDPGVSVADFGSGVVTSVIPNETAALYGGWKNVGTATYAPILTATAPDGLPTFFPHNDTPVQPGSSLSFTVSLRFTPEGTTASAADAYASFAAKYPSQMTWSDKRILGTAYLASSPSGGDPTVSGGFPTNPRRYFNDPNVNIYTADGLQAFQNRMLAQATANSTNAQNMNAQGVITWDIEGEQYPQNTSYACSPDKIAAVAPEMESTILDTSSPYHGQRLDDAYFGIMAQAGLKIGVCLRPQAFTLGAGGTASQVYLTGNATIIANLENKARFANGRWGATVFYVDSTVDANGGTLDPAIFQQLITDLPTFLFIPEESTTRYYAYSAPFYSFIYHTSLGTPPAVYKAYPRAFGANLVNDVAASTLATYTPQLTQSVADGDILMGHVEYWQANDPTLVSIYRAAGVSTPPATSQATPSISWPTPASIPYGTALSGTQLDASSNVAGIFTYSPAVGTVPGAGTTTLTASFTPADTATYKSTSATVALTVTQARPTISWSAPASIPEGTALSGSQLNATANVPGTFSYLPGAGTVPGAGLTQLGVTFTPTDKQDYTSASASVPLTVTPAAGQKTPTIAWGTPGAITYNTPISGAQLNAVANVPGSFSYSPGAGTILGAGTHTLTATFTPADATNYLSVITTRTLAVSQATPTLSWFPPAAVTYGTPLSGAQLNATANVQGTFAYSPGAGSVLNVGTNTLTATFTSADTTDYTAQSVSTSLVVTSAALPVARLAILSPNPGVSVSGTIVVVGHVDLALDAAGSHLQVDGIEIGTRSVGGSPFLYPLDTTTLSNGAHTLQIWAHDINNTTSLSAPVVLNVAN